LASSSDNVNGTDTPQKIQRSPPQHSECYSELLLSKYRENCSRLQHDLVDTKAKLAASESHVQDLQVELVDIAFLSSSLVRFISHVFYQEEVRQLKALLNSAYQEMYGQAAAPTSALRTNHSTIEMDFDPQPAADTLQNRPQQPSRAVMLQPCLTNSKTQNPTRSGRYAFTCCSSVTRTPTSDFNRKDT
jgi:hypothetical protein